MKDEIVFDLEKFDLKLDTDFIGRIFFLVNEIDSTNTTLLSDKINFKESGTVLFAEKQLQGKGRRERTWTSQPELNLTFSILITNFKTLHEKLSLINLASSLAVAVSIENLYQLKCELKWPNDVLVNKKKISGILIETSFIGKKLERVVVGFGINVNQNAFQGEFRIPPTSLKIELKRNAERETFLAEVLNNFEKLFRILEEDPDYILHEWRSKCKMIGYKVTIMDEISTRSGMFEGIDSDGFMILQMNDKLEKIHYGDVSLSL